MKLQIQFRLSEAKQVNWLANITDILLCFHQEIESFPSSSVRSGSGREPARHGSAPNELESRGGVVFPWLGVRLRDGTGGEVVGAAF